MNRPIVPTRRTVSRLPDSEAATIRDLIQNTFVAALLAKPTEAFLISAWITEYDVIDNRAGQFGSVVPSLPEAQIRLSEFLIALARGGCNVCIIAREVDTNRRFYDRIAEAGVDAPIHMRLREDQHQKTLVISDLAVLSGSMNFTWSGVHRNGETLSLSLEPTEVAEALSEARAAWMDAANA